MPYDIGDTYPATVSIRDASGVLVDAISIVLTFTLPDATTFTPATSHPSTGIYSYDYLIPAEGRYGVSWVSTQPSSAFTDVFDARPAYPVNIISLRDAKAHLNITSTTHDEEIRGFVETATWSIERHLKKVVSKRTFVDVLREGGYSFTTRKYPLLSIASLVQVLPGGIPYSTASLDFDPKTGLIWDTGGVRFEGPLRITYVAGMTTIPANYAMAAKIIVQHLWQTQRGPAAIGRYSSTGDAASLMAFSGFAIPNAALELLGPPPPLVA